MPAAAARSAMKPGKETNYQKLIRAKEAAHAAEIKALKEQHAVELAALTAKVTDLEQRLHAAEGARTKEEQLGGGSGFSFIASDTAAGTLVGNTGADVASSADPPAQEEDPISTFRQFVVFTRLHSMRC